MATTRINVPSPVARGEIIEIKTIIMHPMESGFRYDSMGSRYPKRIIHTFECLYNGEEVITIDLNTGVASNPLITFFTEATESGTLTFRWHDDDGSIYEETADIEVTDA